MISKFFLFKMLDDTLRPIIAGYASFNDWLGLFLVVMIWLMFIFLIWVALYILFNLICVRKIYENEHNVTADIKNLQYKEAYSTTTMVLSGKLMIPLTTYHPEQYNVVINNEEMGEKTINSKTLYHKVKSKDKVQATIIEKLTHFIWEPISKKKFKEWVVKDVKPI